MTPKELASQLEGSEYPFDVPKALAIQAKESGLVVICGGSDDLVEFYGAFQDKIGGPGKFEIGPNGLIGGFDEVDKGDKDALKAYFAIEGTGREIESVWCDGEYSWTYKTDIPHECFDVVEDGDKYCRGIVFRLADCVKLT
jgi:hypothetical protein